jgi:SAM-dependent methyltransferase
LLDAAIAQDAAAGVTIAYREGRAEALPYADQSFDIVTAGQCWHWFDGDAAAGEAWRVLKPGGHVAVAHFDWLPLPGNVVEATERLILEANPAWPLAGGTGLYPQWPGDLARAGFTELETHSFDISQVYGHDAWRGRIRASAGVRASLDEAATAMFDAKLATLLQGYPNPLSIPHRVWWVTGRRPVS